MQVIIVIMLLSIYLTFEYLVIHYSMYPDLTFIERLKFIFQNKNKNIK